MFADITRDGQASGPIVDDRWSREVEGHRIVCPADITRADSGGNPGEFHTWV
jgi:hypothetical protein